MVLEKFAKLIPGDTYKKKLFFWNLIQYVFMRIFMIALSPFKTNPIIWWVYMVTTEFFTNDGHIYGDFVYIFRGTDIRGVIWWFSILAMVLLSYLWAYRKRKVAKYLRAGSYLVTLISYIFWTVFFIWGEGYVNTGWARKIAEGYDYAGWARKIAAYNYNPFVILMGVISLSAMWFGVIISNGYLIYRGWREED